MQMKHNKGRHLCRRCHADAFQFVGEAGLSLKIRRSRCERTEALFYVQAFKVDLPGDMT